MAGPGGGGQSGGGQSGNLTRQQRQRLQRLERREEAGRDINEARLKKLQKLEAGKEYKGGSTKPGPETDKALEKWLDRQQQRALAGGLLSGPGGAGVGSGELVALLRSNPELAAQVRAWMAENRGTGLGMSGALGGQARLFEAFPALSDQYIAALGAGYITDAQGQARRLVPRDYTGPVAEGWSLVVPDLYNAKGEVIEPTQLFQLHHNRPDRAGGADEEDDEDGLHMGAVPTDDPDAAAMFRAAFGGFDDETLQNLGTVLGNMLSARQQRLAAQNTYFGLPDLTEEVE